MSVTFSGIVAKFVSAAKSLKSDILKAAGKVPVIVAEVEKDAPEVQALIALAFPGAAAIETAALNVFEVIANAVEAAGPTATANGLNVSLDKALIADIEALIPSLKAFAAKL